MHICHACTCLCNAKPPDLPVIQVEDKVEIRLVDGMLSAANVVLGLFWRVWVFTVAECLQTVLCNRFPNTVPVFRSKTPKS